MLKPLLLLCCAATIVSAGDPKNDLNKETTVLTSSANSGIAANPTAPLEPTKLPVPSSSKDVHVPPESNADAKSNVQTSNSNTNIHPNDSTGPKPSIPPVNPPTVIVTTTTTPHTTTPPSTTTSTKPTTTSTTSTPTTTPVPTTPAPPTPLPPPGVGKWMVKENNTLCIMVTIAAQFNISYANANNVTIHKALDIPVNGTVTGVCGKTEQNLTLTWKPKNDSINVDSFTLHFVKNETDKHYSLHHLEISLAPEEFPNDKSNNTVTLLHMAPQFNTELSNSYRCFKEQPLNLTVQGRNGTVGQLKVSNFQFQAFRSDNSTIFGLAQDCSFNTPDIVPITVGCALAGLVVIVLIAYLFGRRRSQARGYLSM